MRFSDLPISDAHIHLLWDLPLAERETLLCRLIRELNYDTVTVHAIPYCATRPTKCLDLTENLNAFYLKHRLAGKVYAFAGLTPSYAKERNTPEFFLAQAKFYHAAGFDGLKMLEGKPAQRAACGSLDDPKYDLVFGYLEDNGIPLVIHAGDPAPFWREGGEYYGTPLGEVPLASYQNEVLAVLKRHPKLRVTLAHFFFASEQPAFLEALLDTYENVYLDVCPNPFMYIDFAKNEPVWRAFFEKYQDRILYGTDIGSNTTDRDGTEARALYRMVRGFLENDAPATELGWHVPPLRMPENILRKIYKENMMAFYQGKEPRALNYEVMKEELDTVLDEWYTFLDIKDIANLKLIKTIF